MTELILERTGIQPTDWPGEIVSDFGWSIAWSWCNIIQWDAHLSPLVMAIEEEAKVIRVLLEADGEYVDHHHLLDQITLADAYGIEQVILHCPRDYWNGTARERAHWRNVLNVYKDWTGTHDNPHIFFSLQDRGLPVPEVVAAE